MKIIFSTTGSKGNCSVIESGDGHLLVIDAGIKYKTVDRAIGYRLHTADYILITHRHKDHIAYLNEFCRSSIIEFSVFKANVADDLKYFKVSPLEMVHTNSDGTPCQCFGFLILDKSTGEKMLWATDTQYIKNKFLPLDFYCIECNYFEHDTYDGELDYIQKIVEQRRVQSHMSFETCIKFLKKQDLSKCKEIHLLHLSTSMEEKMKKSIKRRMKRALKNEFGGRDIKIYV